MKADEDRLLRLLRQAGYGRDDADHLLRGGFRTMPLSAFVEGDDFLTDYDQQVQEEVSRLIREREPGPTPVAAIREFVLDTVDGIGRVPAGQWRGELGYLAAISPTVHRLALEMSDRQAESIAAAIADRGAVTPETARLQGIVLAGVFQLIVSEAGRRTEKGQTQARIVSELRPAIEAILDDLERWFASAERGSH